MVDIFEHLVGRDPPRRSLALVCKEWREWILNTPCLWRHIQVHFVTNVALRRYLIKINRRIELSGSVPLNITLSTVGFTYIACNVEPFKAIASSGMGRWESLTLLNETALVPIDFLNGIFNSHLTSLRSLEIRYLNKHDPFQPLNECIVKSNPPISNLDLDLPPTSLQGTAVFQRILRLRAPPDVIMKLHPLRGLQYLYVRYIGTSHSYTNPALFPVLPETTTFEYVRKSHLRDFQLHNIRFMEIYFKRETEVVMLEFPSLESLDIRSGDLTDIKGLSAPKLHSLKIRYNGLFTSVAEESKIVTAFFRDDLALVQMHPLRLDLFINTTVETLVLVLQHWSQVQHISLRFRRFAMKKAFIKELIGNSNQLCPKLVTLYMESLISMEEIEEEFVVVARQLLQERKDAVLNWIEWKSGSKDWGQLRNADVN